MSAIEFLQTRGLPGEPRPLHEGEAEAAKGRLPDDLIALWEKTGIGHYADRNYWLCTPSTFDDLLSRMLANAPDLAAQDLAAFGYSALGYVDLLHRDGRHFTLSLDVAVLMDLTSRTRTDPLPHDLEGLFRSAGMPMPDNAEELIRASRMAPEDVWMLLATATDPAIYGMIVDDHGKILAPQLRQVLGELSPGEIYLRNKESPVDEVGQYRRMTLDQAAEMVTGDVIYSYATEVSGVQRIMEQTFPAAAR